MAGIVSYGAYIPKLRLDRKLIAQSWGIPAAPGEIAVGNFDEDALTMALEAGRDCILDDPTGVGGVYFASTSAPYAEKSCATVVASVLDLPEDSVTADFGASLSAGATAMALAAAGVDDGVAQNILVTAGECRIPESKTADEQTFGDGAGAMLIGKDNVIAEIKGVHNSYDEVLGAWRLPGDASVRDVGARFYASKGYVPGMVQALKAAVEKFGLKLEDISKVVYSGPDFRSHGQVAKILKLSPEQVQDALFAFVGGCGSAQCLMMLAAALEDARPGDKILFAGAGDAYVVMFLEVTDAIAKLPPRRAIKGHLASRQALASYAKYLEYKEVLKTGEPDGAGSMIQMWRDRKAILPLYGKKCLECETVYFPPRHVCPNCHAFDKNEDVRLARKGKLWNFIDDNLYVSVEAPTTLAISDLDDGSRIFTQMTDRNVGEVELDMPVELTFRKIHDGGNFRNYFWKMRPVR